MKWIVKDKRYRNLLSPKWRCIPLSCSCFRGNVGNGFSRDKYIFPPKK